MKCITQIPVVPMDRAARVSQRARAAPCSDPRPGGAPEPEEAAHARHDVRERRIESTVEAKLLT